MTQEKNVNEADGIVAVGSTDGLCALLDALKKGEQLVTPDPDFGADGCHGLELYQGQLYLKGVGSAFCGNLSTWLIDLLMRPEAWMTLIAFEAHNDPSSATRPAETHK